MNPANPASGRPKAPRSGFTLIELLIVVAIIAILAAIAVPNFLEAQIRAKVSRAKADHRSLATAIESYFVDNNEYPDPLPPPPDRPGFLCLVTTPIAYMSSLPQDVFRLENVDPSSPFAFFVRLYGYGATSGEVGAPVIDTPNRFVLESLGPDLDLDTYVDGVPDPLALVFYPGYAESLFTPPGLPVGSTVQLYIKYDPTNGTVSSGDIHRFSDHQGL